MSQNKYDDPKFFEGYSKMPRSQEGLAAAGEWHVLKKMLPEFKNKSVLDLGCGFGWHCRYAVEQGAAYVMGVDLSQKMLERAQEINSADQIEYRRAGIEEAEFKAEQFDVVISSLAFHYIENFAAICKKIHSWLVPAGSFVFSVEHPIFTSLEAQDWYMGANGERLHWPVDHYQDQTIRHSKWLTGDVTKYHRTFSGYMNALIQAGFQIQEIQEPVPSEEMMQKWPKEAHDETRRPMFLLVSAKK